MKKPKTLMPCLFEVIREMREKWVGKGRGKKNDQLFSWGEKGGKRNGLDGIFHLIHHFFFQSKLGRKKENGTNKK